MTEFLFRDDATLREATATVVTVEPDGGIVLDRTPFYPQGGGQPGDTGTLVIDDGRRIPIATTRYGADKSTIVHVPAPDGPALQPGDRVTAILDWEPRWNRMRVHTALHLLTAVLPYPVTGGAIGEGDGRLDFDIPDAGFDKAEIEAKLNALIATDAEVRTRWITDEELLANPGLVKTMSVKPPMGTGRIRLVEIVGLDLQPCGGTHVARTGEIGTAVITAIEKKGKQNRRVRVRLAD
ncbi:alanyl-tRNA editing protein [Lichenifustis flavocetrariae]|uniref:Alanine--tRNA ligase n=1 Tax=Lichenifustis flavocetrariae TaxID=2949735 RepID=A0AA41YVE9_9HYPH|nr:alanyl-tRNA editing protein [Lichenifustis flavocetrariae]MCW6507931.1 alanyl-tRNA editing protein [Lichenifustis flavocetrariae]